VNFRLGFGIGRKRLGTARLGTRFQIEAANHPDPFDLQTPNLDGRGGSFIPIDPAFRSAQVWW